MMAGFRSANIFVDFSNGPMAPDIFEKPGLCQAPLMAPARRNNTTSLQFERCWKSLSCRLHCSVREAPVENQGLKVKKSLENLCMYFLLVVMAIASLSRKTPIYSFRISGGTLISDMWKYHE